MCEPGLIIGAVGTLVGAFAQKQAVEADNKAMEYNAQMQERNATIAQQQSQDAQIRGQEEETRHRQRVSQLKGTQRSALAASGVQVDTGSAFDVIEDTTRSGELDALSIRHNAGMETWGHQVQSSNYQGQAGLARAQKRSPGMAFGTSLLTGGSRLASNYFNSR